MVHIKISTYFGNQIHGFQSEMRRRSRDFYLELRGRRSVRRFSAEPFPQEVMDDLVRAAGTAPSGGHTEPWTYVVVRRREYQHHARFSCEFAFPNIVVEKQTNKKKKQIIRRCRSLR